MKKSQDYISNELTHFVGRNLNKEEDQYKLLVKIVKDGRLTSCPSHPTNYGLHINYKVKFSENEVCTPDMVCFCDIPIKDISIHISKYSSFGLSFLKEFLLPNGANPVSYIAKDAKLIDRSSRGNYFDKMVKCRKEFFDLLKEYIKKHKQDDVNLKRLSELGTTLEHFLDWDIFSYIKCFDGKLAEDDSENFYMEREWRLLGSLKFKINDVHRIILPEKYSKRFKKDIPHYSGKITIAPSVSKNKRIRTNKSKFPYVINVEIEK